MNAEQEAIKVVLLGAAGVGKSSIVKRYITDDFSPLEQSTLGSSYHSKTVKYKENSYKLQIWDTAGQEKYAPLAVMYYRDAHVVLLVYDRSSKESFDVLKKWYEEVNEKGSTNAILFVVGNKSDIDVEEVTPATAKSYADSIDALWKTISAKNNDGIKELFECIIAQVLSKKGMLTSGKKGGGSFLTKNPETSNGTPRSNAKPSTDNGKSGCC